MPYYHWYQEVRVQGSDLPRTYNFDVPFPEGGQIYAVSPDVGVIDSGYGTPYVEVTEAPSNLVGQVMSKGDTLKVKWTLIRREGMPDTGTYWFYPNIDSYTVEGTIGATPSAPATPQAPAQISQGQLVTGGEINPEWLKLHPEFVASTTPIARTPSEEVARLSAFDVMPIASNAPTVTTQSVAPSVAAPTLAAPTLTPTGLSLIEIAAMIGLGVLALLIL